MSQTLNYWAVVPAAGVGRRMNAVRPKQYLSLKGKTVIEQTLTRLLDADIFAGIAVAISQEDSYWPELALSGHEKIITAPGGKERADSVLSGLRTIENTANKKDWVLVHDAARPCLALEDINKLIDTLKNDEVGGILALPSHDTLKNVEGYQILGTLDRRSVWRALTPQMFRYGLLKSALEETMGDPRITDEASAIELRGLRPKIVEGRPDNIKITRPEDLALAQFLPGTTMIRIGHGYDVHRFNDGDHIILGGVTIPYERGLEAHSDGDVVLHALSDALLGAAALGDIGKHFPDTDPNFKGADSRVLLRHVYNIVKDKGYHFVNADITIIAQAPKMAPYIVAICQNIAADLATHPGYINVKATTTEKLGFEGRKEGISVHAVALIEK